MALCGASDTIAMRQSRRPEVHRIIDQTRALNRDLSYAFDYSFGDTWMHQELLIFIEQTKLSESVGCVMRSWGNTWMHQELSIFIGRAKLRENVDCVVGHDSTDFARSDGSILIAKQTVHISRRIFPLKTDVFSSFS